MAYVKTIWTEQTEINTTRFNNLETQYDESKSYTDAELAKKLDKSGGIMTGILTAQNNTSYTTKQVRNIILSTADADVNGMENGDIWIKYG